MRHILATLSAAMAALALGGASPCRAAPASGADPVEQTEESDIVRLPPAGPHRILVYDAAGRHAKDGRVYAVDADGGKLLGMVQGADYANVAQSPDGHAFYVAETVWSRGNRGERQDLLASYDAQTMLITNDFRLPGRALVTSKKNDFALNADGTLAYVFDMVPTNAVHVFDTRTHAITQTVGLPGCALVYPWGNAGFSSICSDGGLIDASLDGTASHLHRTKPFFDPDQDAVFEHSPENHATGSALFLSYTGLVYPARLSATSTIDRPWSIQEAAGMARAPDAAHPFAVAWRPGGWQLAAWHYKSDHLFVLMHQGPFWTHKMPGTEVWELDASSHKLLRRIRLPRPSTLLGITQDAHPLMFTDDPDGDLLIWNAETGALERTMPHLGSDLYFTVAIGE